MPNPILLTMTIRHQTESGELISIIKSGEVLYTGLGMTNLTLKHRSLTHWCPGSGVVLDCIDSWSAHLYFLYVTLN